MRPPATPAISIARPRSTTTSGFSPMRRAHNAPAAVANRNPESNRTKYDGKLTPSARNSSGRMVCDRRASRTVARRRRPSSAPRGRHRTLDRTRVGRRWRGHRGGARLLRREHVDRHQTHADADRDVRDVERGPMMVMALVGEVDVDEVDDVAIADTVEHVSQGPSEDQGQPPPEGT